MAIFSFGETVPGFGFKVMNERVIRGISGIGFLMGMIAFIHAFILSHYGVLPLVSGILLFHFLTAVLINPNFSPITLLARLFVRKQTPIYIGAVQKRFAWSLGVALTATIFILGMLLYTSGDIKYFQPACSLCIICMLLMFLETAFGICVGCKLYFLAIRLKLIKKPEIMPNCMGDVCEVK
ncbi:MAG: DUF4395 domain-containing protein [Bacteroidales bacterium]|nr:DUF4395 domain-containing protein [Bacteroidales bacterium]